MNIDKLYKNIMESKMQIIESYITQYEFRIQKKIISKEKLLIDLNLGYKILNPEKKEDETLVGLILKNSIILKEKNDEFGKINTNIFGLFKFESKLQQEKEYKKILRRDGVSILYQQLRSYVSANTALSQSVPTINLPVINFIDDLGK